MKKNGMLLTLTVALLAALGTAAWAGPAGLDPTALAADRLLDAHWSFIDARETDGAEGAADRVKKEADGLIARVVDALRRGDRGPAEALAARYAALTPAERPALDPAVV
jgi:hypothetical protein